MHVYFHLHECGTVTEDRAGRHCPDLPAAIQSATRAARDVMAGEVQQGRLCLACYILIADEDQKELSRVMFHDVLTVTGFVATAN